MIKMEREQWTTNENIDLDVISVESEGKILNIGVSWDKILGAVTVMYNEVDDKNFLTAAELKDFKMAKTTTFSTPEQARNYFNDIRNPVKVVHLVKAHQRKEKK